LKTNKDATLGAKKAIGDQLRQDQKLLVVDAFQTVENVVRDKCAYLGVRIKVEMLVNLLNESYYINFFLCNYFEKTVSITNYIVYEDTKANEGKCRMTTSPELAAYRAIAFQIGLVPDSFFLYSFNE
jgi:hypothetical protein